MVMEWNYGGGLFLEFQPLTDCMLCEGVGCPYCRLYCSLWGLGGLCAGWCVDCVLGRVVLFLGFIPKYGVDVGMVVYTNLLYVVMCCMFTMSLRCVFISLWGDTLCMGPRYWLLLVYKDTKGMTNHMVRISTRPAYTTGKNSRSLGGPQNQSGPLRKEGSLTSAERETMISQASNPYLGYYTE